MDVVAVVDDNDEGDDVDGRLFDKVSLNTAARSVASRERRGRTVRVRDRSRSIA